jgi:tricorn protease
VVDEDSLQVTAGHDPQLERAIEELLEVLSKNPQGLPSRPAAPIKSEAR